MIPPVSGGADERPHPRAARRRRSTRDPDRARRSAGDARGRRGRRASSAERGSRRARRRRVRRPRPPATTGDRSSPWSTRPTSRWPSVPSRRSPTRSPPGSASSASPSSIGPATCRSARSSVAIVAVSPHRDAAFDAARYAIDETKARAPIWKAERFADGHVWIGEAARTGHPDRPRGAAREGLHQRRHGGHRRGQPPGPDRPDRSSLPGVGRSHGRRDERRDRGRARRWGDRHPGQRQPLEHVQPAAGRAAPGCPRAAGPEGVVDGRRRPARIRTASRRSTSHCSSATTRGPGTGPGRSPTRTRGCRSRRGWMAARPASTA